jgi:hypothetical protein
MARDGFLRPEGLGSHQAARADPTPATHPFRPKGLQSPWQGPQTAPIGVIYPIPRRADHLRGHGRTVGRMPTAPWGALVAWASSPRRVDRLRGGGTTAGRMPTAPWEAMVAWASSPRRVDRLRGGGTTAGRMPTSPREAMGTRRRVSPGTRSGGATSAERDGRPVHRRAIPSAAAGSESLRTHDFCVWRFSVLGTEMGYHLLLGACSE